MNAPTILTGDRPTGPRCTSGHFVGSLRQRVALRQTQPVCADCRPAGADRRNGSNPQKIRDNIPEVLADYLAAGIDPNLTTHLPAVRPTRPRRLTMLYKHRHRRPRDGA